MKISSNPLQFRYKASAIEMVCRGPYRVTTKQYRHVSSNWYVPYDDKIVTRATPRPFVCSHIEGGATLAEVARKVGVSRAAVNRIIEGREQIAHKIFLKMMDELG